MKSFVLLALCAAFVQCNPSVFDKSSILKCPVCKVLVENSESWLGEEGQKDEGAAVNLCMVETSRVGVGAHESDEICDVIVKEMLDVIIVNMENKNETSEGAHFVCVKAGYCRK